MSIPGRIYRIAQSYLGTARDRLNAIDAAAQEELRRALPDDPDYGMPAASVGTPVASTLDSGDDAFSRAASKISQSRAANQARQSAQPEHYNFSNAATSLTPAKIPPAATADAPPDVVVTAYQMIGVAVGSPYPAVEKAVARLRARCAPSRFPEGSAEQAEAKEILAKVEDALRVLQTALGVPVTRFDRLEL
jgi:hypothetical protein